jgi:hypothetical protein
MQIQKPSYAIPDHPADPETAALELIVRLPSALSARLADSAEACGLTEILQDYCGVLQIEGAFAALSWDDAKRIAVAICFDICNRDDPAAFIRGRASRMLEGTDNTEWNDREASARALSIAARVLGS